MTVSAPTAPAPACPPAAAIANARMYAATPAIEDAWRALLAHVADDAGVPLAYTPYPAPAPMDVLWARPDLGCALMCGYPIALGLSPVVPIAAPVPSAPWAAGRAVYRTDLIVRRDAPFRTLEDSFGTRIGWTVEHSHSGFNAVRHHLLAYRTPARPALYAGSVGPLVTPRGVLDAVLDGTIDVGPLDAYWHLLIRRADHSRLDGIRVIASTATAPMPAFVAAEGADAATIAALRAALVEAAARPWFAELAQPLCLDGFAAVDQAAFVQTLSWDTEARVAGYDRPA